MTVTSSHPARNRLFAEIRAICEPFWFHPIMAGILTAVEADSIRAVTIAVNAALRDPAFRSTALRRALLDWGAKVNAARDQAVIDRTAAA